MGYKDVFDVFKRERRLNDDETAFLNSLRHMTDAERELLAKTLGSPAKAAAKTAVKQRKIEHCGVLFDGHPCDLTRRARIHKDQDIPDYHEFVPSFATLREEKVKPKSARANGMAAQLNKNLAAQKRIIGDTRAPLLCDFSIDGKVCKGAATDAIHDEAMGYGGYHPFQSGVHSAESSSSIDRSGASSEVETASVSTATGG